MESDRFLTESLRDPRILRVLASAVSAVQPDRLVEKYLDGMVLPKYNHLFLLGIGKAAESMTFAAAQILGDLTKGLIITKHSDHKESDAIEIMEAGHPIPDSRSLAAGAAVLEFVTSLHEDDLLICLISGGGSSLVASPQPGISLADLQRLTTSLLASGATIEEINTVRCKLDRLKAGGLARTTNAKIISLILSDVNGDRLDVIASGLTVPRPMTNLNALSILDKYKLKSGDLLRALDSTDPQLNEPQPGHVQNILVGNNKTAVQEAKVQAEHEGFQTTHQATDIQGEARIVGKQMAQRLAEAADTMARPFCMIAGGETTVTLRGNGRGGRNQELVLAAVETLDGLQNVMLISFATDGDDGPTDAAGAVITGKTFMRAARLGMSPAGYLERNDSYEFFLSLNDLLKTGYTGTNVNDLVFLIGF